MDKKKLIERNNKEGLGKYFLKKAVNFAFDKSFGKSYEYIKEGLDILTCDCGNWRNRYKNSDKTLFTDLLINTTEHIEYYFVKGYILCFEDDKKALYVGLEAIDKYLSQREDEYGFYVKGEILLSLGEHTKAYEAFMQGMQFDTNPRLLYKIGRTKEQHLSEFGLEDLFNSFDANPSSACCARILKKYMKERDIRLIRRKNESNKLLISFTDLEDEWKFDNLYEKYFNEEIFKNGPFDIQEHIETLPVIKEFINEIRKNSDFFQNEDESHHEYHGDSHYDSHDDYTHPHDSSYYNDALDMDQQSPEFWDNI